METFNEIINGDMPVMVDFYAVWCSPCREISPIVDELEQEEQGEARVIKIDVDKNQDIAEQYQIRAIPTFVLFKKGQEVWRSTGRVNKDALLRQIKMSLG
jgi:thioredoxin 1